MKRKPYKQRDISNFVNVENYPIGSTRRKTYIREDGRVIQSIETILAFHKIAVSHYNDEGFKIGDTMILPIHFAPVFSDKDWTIE